MSVISLGGITNSGQAADVGIGGHTFPMSFALTTRGAAAGGAGLSLSWRGPLKQSLYNLVACAGSGS